MKPTGLRRLWFTSRRTVMTQWALFLAPFVPSEMGVSHVAYAGPELWTSGLPDVWLLSQGQAFS